MKTIDKDLQSITEHFPSDFTENEKAFNVWYTPGVSAVSTGIRDNHDSSFMLSNRGNLVAVVSDSTRVLGDGDCSPSGGLGVMEGKCMLMKYLGGVDACFKVLDTLREECDIPVWHDDAQGTACITLAGLLNALKLAGKKIGDCRIVLLGAGASNTTIARLILQDGGDPAKMIICDSQGALHAGRDDIKADARYYRKWELCRATNPKRINSFDEALKGADVLIALSHCVYLCKPHPRNLAARCQSCRRLYHRYRTRRLSEPNQQLHLFPRNFKRRPACPCT